MIENGKKTEEIAPEEWPQVPCACTYAPFAWDEHFLLPRAPCSQKPCPWYWVKTHFLLVFQAGSAIKHNFLLLTPK
jgi:hypothetical protein